MVKSIKRIFKYSSYTHIHIFRYIHTLFLFKLHLTLALVRFFDFCMFLTQFFFLFFSVFQFSCFQWQLVRIWKLFNYYTLFAQDLGFFFFNWNNLLHSISSLLAYKKCGFSFGFLLTRLSFSYLKRKKFNFLTDFLWIFSSYIIYIQRMHKYCYEKKINGRSSFENVCVKKKNNVYNTKSMGFVYVLFLFLVCVLF